LGSLLIDRDSVIKISDIVTRHDFYDDNHGVIYEAILELYKKNKPIDLVTVSEILSGRGELDLI